MRCPRGGVFYACVCVFSLLFRPTRAVYSSVLLCGVMSRAPKSGGPCAWAVNLAKQMDIHPVPTVTPFRKRVLQLLQTVPEGASHDVWHAPSSVVVRVLMVPLSCVASAR